MNINFISKIFNNQPEKGVAIVKNKPQQENKISCSFCSAEDYRHVGYALYECNCCKNWFVILKNDAKNEKI